MVALIAHPDDERYQPLFGTTVTSPVFGVEVPVVAHPLAEMDKGAGIAMCCTFGDLTDVTWWRELDLPVRTVIGRDGRFTRETPEWLAGRAAAPAYERLAGKTVFSAREEMVAMLRETGDLEGDPQPTQRMANFYEKGDKPLEIVSTRQWYIRNGGRDAALRAEMLERGAEISGSQPHMKHRFDNWVGGLNGDWLISRQRFFGIPFPVWYPLDDEGEPDYAHPLIAPRGRAPGRPVDAGPAWLRRGAARQARRLRRRPGRHGHLGHVVAHPAHRGRVGDRQRPVRAGLPDGPVHPRARHHPHLAVLARRPVPLRERHVAPWSHAMISGFIVDPDRKKMSKSKGNVVVPDEILVDVRRRRRALAGRDRPARPRLAVRRVADEGRPTAGDEGAQRLEVRPRRRRGDCAERVRGLRADRLRAARPPRPGHHAATDAFEAYDYTTALEVTEKFFWEFCDDYLELVKERAYDESGGHRA